MQAKATQDDYLSRIGRGVGDLKEIALAQQDELNRQNPILEVRGLRSHGAVTGCGMDCGSRPAPCCLHSSRRARHPALCAACMDPARLHVCSCQAHDNSLAACPQTVETRVDKLTSELRSNNAKLKEVLFHVRTTRKFCIDFILIIVALGIGMYIFQMIKK